jgi:hypothetical protein
MSQISIGSLGVNRFGKAIVSNKSGGSGIERPGGTVHQDTADRFNALETDWIVPCVDLAKSTLKVSSPKLQDKAMDKRMEAGLEISGHLLTGIPGAILKLVSIDGQTMALLSKEGDQAATPLDVKTELLNSSTMTVITLPDNNTLLLTGLSDQADKLGFSRSLGSKTSLDTWFEMGEQGYELASFSMELSGKNSLDAIGAEQLNTEQPSSYVVKYDGQRGRWARTVDGASSTISSKPRYTDDYQAIESDQATLDSLEDSARAVWADIGYILKP